MHAHDMSLWFEEVDQADAPMSPEEWLFNIGTFAFAVIAIAT
ncbi:hypothetical protein J2Y69_001562 [Microbacterium resistens]|uniref:Uncharacterized protein n=1 Tax=Microbacterium resistens TaxID=156977 RepID=A0ABU1SDI4_9MICO|nr:hypothetical protein [Microbacterium resistens]MDR6866963.1 hypothetical protein [Microbacterium resistens]